MKITSPNLIPNQQIPTKYTCDGQGLLPEISWSDFPPETKGFALIIEDPDAPMETYVHLLTTNIPKNITKIIEGTTNISGAELIANSSSKVSYVPPCPPNGSHRYIFKIFALDIEMIDNINKDNFYEKIDSHVIDSAELVGLYQRAR